MHARVLVTLRKGVLDPAGQAVRASLNHLGFGEVKSTLDVTEGGLVVTPDENTRRTQALRKLAGTPPAAGSNVVIVTHKPNIMDAFGKDWFDVREGEASMFKPDGNGGYKPVVRIKADEWSGLSK